MQVKPLKHLRAPAYPTKAQLMLKPGLLRRVPLRWAKSTAALTALGLTLGLSACSASPAAPAPSASSASAAPAQTPAPEAVAEQAASYVAPLFIHGSGVGSFGCMVINAPYFFSEEEALAIIRSEAQSLAGLDFLSGGKIDGVTLPVPYIDAWPDDAEACFAAGGVEGALALDGQTEDGAGFEFVSTEDLKAWAWKPSGKGSRWSSAGAYYFRDAAQFLRDGVERAAPENPVGIFYDPYSPWGQDNELEEQLDLLQAEASESGDYETLYDRQCELYREYGEKQLRAQVRDFIDWLTGQGFI